MFDPNEGVEPMDAAQFYGERPTVAFLCAAIRAEVFDMMSKRVYPRGDESGLGRVLELVTEIERRVRGLPNV